MFSVKKFCANILLAVMIMTSSIVSPKTIVFAASDDGQNESASDLSQLSDIVRAHAMDRDTSFKVTYIGDPYDLYPVLNLEFLIRNISINDDPSTCEDADYLVGNWFYGNDFDVTQSGDVLTFKLKYYESKKESEYVRDQIPGILKRLGVDGMSNYDKVVAIHDYVCKTITYTADPKNTGKYSSMYSALKSGKGLCNSYALCMYRLLTEAGVPCKYIGGKAGTGKDAEGHAWNLVALGDRWYCLDATWDDRNDKITKNYFLKGSLDFDNYNPKLSHVMDTEYSTSPFSAYFPVALKAFKKGSDDTNHVITIGGTEAPDVSSDDQKFTFSDLTCGKYPNSGKFIVKKGKMSYLQVHIKPQARKLISSASYSITAGKGNIKKINDYGISYDSNAGMYYFDMDFTGKKVGQVNIKITLMLTNGQSISYTFKGKVK